jgi:Actinobacteria/chloroflexi VLRF1 release factor
VSSRPAAGGGRWIEVDPDRLTRWFAGFVERHGAIAVDPGPTGLRVRAFDGAIAECQPPPGAPPVRDLDDLVAHALLERRLGLLLARRGGVAVGVATGDVLEASKVDSRYVQGRTAAGGWSQQRFARRRENQARAAAGDAADIVARLLVPAAPGLAALVTGGDRRTVEAILADPRLAVLAPLRVARFLAVAEPRLATLAAAVRRARSVLIRLVDPGPDPDS